MCNLDHMALAELAARLQAEKGTPQVPEIVAASAIELMALAGAISRRAVRECNEPLTDKQQNRADLADLRAYERANEIMQTLGLPPVQRMSDARGYAIKIMLPSGRYNSMGGAEEGWGI